MRGLMRKILKVLYFDKKQLERLARLSAKTRVPQAVYVREGLNLVLKKYEANLRGRHKKQERH